MSEIEHTAERALKSTGLFASSVPGEGGFIVDVRNQGNLLHDRPHYRQSPLPNAAESERIRRLQQRAAGIPDHLRLTPLGRLAEKIHQMTAPPDMVLRASREERIAEEKAPTPEPRDVVGQSSSFIIANVNVDSARDALEVPRLDRASEVLPEAVGDSIGLDEEVDPVRSFVFEVFDENKNSVYSQELEEKYMTRPDVLQVMINRMYLSAKWAELESPAFRVSQKKSVDPQ